MAELMFELSPCNWPLVDEKAAETLCAALSSAWRAAVDVGSFDTVDQAL